MHTSLPITTCSMNNGDNDTGLSTGYVLEQSISGCYIFTELVKVSKGATVWRPVHRENRGTGSMSLCMAREVSMSLYDLRRLMSLCGLGSSYESVWLEKYRCVCIAREVSMGQYGSRHIYESVWIKKYL